MDKIKLWFRRLLCPHTETKQTIKTGHNVHGGVHIYTRCTKCGKIVKKEFFEL